MCLHYLHTSSCCSQLSYVRGWGPPSPPWATDAAAVGPGERGGGRGGEGRLGADTNWEEEKEK